MHGIVWDRPEKKFGSELTTEKDVGYDAVEICTLGIHNERYLRSFPLPPV